MSLSVHLPDQARGLTSYLAGIAAEDAVLRDYELRGCSLMAKRHRGCGGEIDLIVRDGHAVVFVEVKKSRSHALAAGHLSRQQQRRISLSAAEFLDSLPDASLTYARFDVALVDGMGRCEVLENAFGME